MSVLLQLTAISQITSSTTDSDGNAGDVMIEDVDSLFLTEDSRIVSITVNGSNGNGGVLSISTILVSA